MKKRYQKAITYGTYDLFHIGHVRLFERIKQHADTLIVAISTDEFNHAKGKSSVIPFADRIELVSACRYVDAVIIEQSWAQKRNDVAEHGIQLFAMGDDWKGKFDDLRDACDVIYLPRTDGVSSSDIKSLIKQPSTQ